ncbi:hypothetical protein ACODT5_16085 [Streptomyces sp. 5.8]|uniref:hypothetical protein n=1 Tax=Streptomyces sp. 5.8 TaxID=3406571 RepID=UPI003BB578E6
MHRQLEAEDHDRHQAAGPHFEIDQAYTERGNTPYGVLVLRQTSGPALDSVLVTAAGAGVEGLRGAYDSANNAYDCVNEYDIAPMAAGNGTVEVYVQLDYHHHETKIILNLKCRTQGTSRVWERSVYDNVAPTPEPPRRRTDRSPFIQ